MGSVQLNVCGLWWVWYGRRWDPAEVVVFLAPHAASPNRPDDAPVPSRGGLERKTLLDDEWPVRAGVVIIRVIENEDESRES